MAETPSDSTAASSQEPRPYLAAFNPALTLTLNFRAFGGRMIEYEEPPEYARRNYFLKQDVASLASYMRDYVDPALLVYSDEQEASDGAPVAYVWQRQPMLVDGEPFTPWEVAWYAWKAQSSRSSRASLEDRTTDWAAEAEKVGIVVVGPRPSIPGPLQPDETGDEG